MKFKEGRGWGGGEIGGRNSLNKGNSRAASSLTNKLTFTFTCPGQMLKKEEKAVDLDILVNSFLTFIFPFSSNVANLFCHIPSTIRTASSSPGFTQSII